MTAPAALDLGLEAEVARRFDRAVGRFKPTVAESDYRLAPLRDRLGLVGGLRVLDLGCGKGRFATRLAEAGASVIGLDVSRRMLGESAHPSVVQGSATRLPWANGAFEAVIAVEVFQHVSAIDAALAEALRVLVPGGRLFVIDKNALALNLHRPCLPNLVVKGIDERRGRGLYRPGESVEERWFTPRGLARRMEGAGFVAVEAEGLLSPEESRRAVFRSRHWSRSMWLWTARRPGGDRCDPC